MDDSKFDGIIKNKMEGYEAPGYDPAALADLHYRMAANTTIPWYTKYRTEMLIGAGFAILALLILFGQWMIGGANTKALRNEIMSLKSQGEELQLLREQIDQLGNQTPDTIRVVEYRELSPVLYSRLLSQIDALQTQLDYQQRLNSKEFEQKRNAGLVYLGNKNNISRDLLEVLKREGLAIIDGEDLFLTTSMQNLKMAKKKGVTQNYVLPYYRFVIDTVETEEVVSSSKIVDKEVQITLSKRRELERHYQKGVGINIGPAAHIFNRIYTSGEGGLDLGGGIMADFIVSPSLSIEAGVIFSENGYEVEGRGLREINFPNIRDDLGTLNSSGAEFWSLNIPINLKYRKPLSLNTNGLLSAGYTSWIYTKQIVEYNYLFAVENGIKLGTESSFREKSFRTYPGALNLGIGISKRLKNDKMFEASFNYQYGLGTAGVQSIDNSYLGVRGVYWFRMK